MTDTVSHVTRAAESQDRSRPDVAEARASCTPIGPTTSLATMPVVVIAALALAGFTTQPSGVEARTADSQFALRRSGRS
jgi:hypothetical protein